jgi:hypothetical protein
MNSTISANSLNLFLKKFNLKLTTDPDDYFWKYVKFDSDENVYFSIVFSANSKGFIALGGIVFFAFSGKEKSKSISDSVWQISIQSVTPEDVAFNLIETCIDSVNVNRNFTLKKLKPKDIDVLPIETVEKMCDLLNFNIRCCDNSMRRSIKSYRHHIVKNKL